MGSSFIVLYVVVMDVCYAGLVLIYIQCVPLTGV